MHRHQPAPNRLRRMRGHLSATALGFKSIKLYSNAKRVHQKALDPHCRLCRQSRSQFGLILCQRTAPTVIRALNKPTTPRHWQRHTRTHKHRRHQSRTTATSNIPPMPSHYATGMLWGHTLYAWCRVYISVAFYYPMGAMCMCVLYSYHLRAFSRIRMFTRTDTTHECQCACYATFHVGHTRPFGRYN